MLLSLKWTVAAALLYGAMTAQALERTELLPPADTYLRITRAQELRDALDRAYGDRFRTDGQMQDFMDAFGQKIRKKGEEGKIPLELRQLFEMYKILKGEIAMVYSGTGKILQPSHLFLAAGVSAEDYNTILDRTAWVQTRQDEAVVRKHETFQGTELVHDIIQGGSTNEANYWMGCINGTLLLGSERAWVEQNIVRLGNEVIKEPETCRFSMRFPLGIWIRENIRNCEAEKRIAMESSWSALGILAIEQYLLEIDVQDEKLIIDGTLSISDMERGIFSLLDTEPADFSTDRIVPPDATSFSYGKLDLAGFWRQLPEMLSGLPPKHSAGMMGLLTFFEKQSGLNIEYDILAHIGPRYSLHTEQVSTNQPVLISIELNNGKDLGESLIRLLTSPFAASWAPSVKTADFRGYTLHRIVPPNSTANDPMALSVAGNYLLFSTRETILRKAILRCESETRTTPSVLQASARSAAPESAFGYGGMNHQQAHTLISVTMSDTGFSAGIAYNSSGVVKQELGDNEISLNHLTSYLSSTYHYAEAVPEGIHHRLIIETEGKQGAP